MFNKELNSILERDLLDLISSQTAEGRTLEYKRDLPGRTDAEKKEFLADISSFANTSGGDLIYGIEESQGIPTSIVGLNGADMDAEKLRLDGMANNGIDPRIRYNMRNVCCNCGNVLIIRVERSWFGPHRVVFQGSDKFYARNQAGKYPLDVDELRQAFTRGTSVAQQTRAFRIDRIIEVSNDRTPIPVSEGPRVLLHVFPFDSFGHGARYDPIQFYRDPTRVPLLGSSLNLVRVNFDGVVVHNGQPTATTYTQIFRSGILEVVNSRVLDHEYEKRRLIPHWRLDRLGRNLADLVRLIAELEQRKINFESLTEKIETRSPAGRLVFHIFAALAEFERNLIRERTVAGLKSARARGRKGGRPAKLSPKEIKTIRALLKTADVPVAEIAARFGIARSTLYRAVLKPAA